MCTRKKDVEKLSCGFEDNEKKKKYANFFICKPKTAYFEGKNKGY
ncbi:Uncharacterised protein [Prevotella disiens]|uniref:Uncharacterized protein n=1 Tax=Prevotella disiens TaxID=28130 RepID=A0A379EFQ1_9BACT|nr:Uncharacterised protein [Prevotella disiens]